MNTSNDRYASKTLRKQFKVSLITYVQYINVTFGKRENTISDIYAVTHGNAFISNTISLIITCPNFRRCLTYKFKHHLNGLGK